MTVLKLTREAICSFLAKYGSKNWLVGQFSDRFVVMSFTKNIPNSFYDVLTSQTLFTKAPLLGTLDTPSHSVNPLIEAENASFQNVHLLTEGKATTASKRVLRPRRDNQNETFIEECQGSSKRSKCPFEADLQYSFCKS